MTRLKCPRCHWLVEVGPEAAPRCPHCGFQGPRPQPTPAPAPAYPTQRAQPAGAYAGQAPFPLQPDEAPPRREPSGKATAALVLGIATIVLAFFPYVNIIAITAAFIALFLGVAAIHDCNLHPETRTGKGRAATGMGLAVIGLAIGLFVLLLMLAL